VDVMSCSVSRHFCIFKGILEPSEGLLGLGCGKRAFSGTGDGVCTGVM
jgi:hypothetical protein